jgi:hypothetical protein
MKVPISSIVRDVRAQPRVAINTELIAQYAAEMARGDQFPAVVAYGTRNKSFLADGWHRLHAMEQNGLTDVEIDLRQGSREDAIRHSCGANADHGLRRAHEDIARAVATALGEWPELSDRALAQICAVSPPTIAAHRQKLEGAGSIPPAPERKVTRVTTSGVTATYTHKVQPVPKPNKSASATRTPSAVAEPDDGTDSQDDAPEAPVGPPASPQTAPDAPIDQAKAFAVLYSYRKLPSLSAREAAGAMLKYGLTDEQVDAIGRWFLKVVVQMGEIRDGR